MCVCACVCEFETDNICAVKRNVKIMALSEGRHFLKMFPLQKLVCALKKKLNGKFNCVENFSY